MIGPRHMGNIFRSVVRHMASDAVGIIRMMCLHEGRRSMADKTLGSIKGDSLRRGRAEMGIVATGAGHAVPADALAHTRVELLDFANSAGERVALGVGVEGEVISNRVAGLIIQHRTSSPLDGDVGFQVTTDAKRIPLVRGKLGRVYNGSFSL